MEYEIERKERQAAFARKKNFVNKVEYVDPNYMKKQAGVVVGGMALGFALAAIPFAGVAVGPAACGAVVGGGLHKLEEEAKAQVGDASCLDNLLVMADGDMDYGEDRPATSFDPEDDAEYNPGFVPSWEQNKKTVPSFASENSSSQSIRNIPLVEEDDDDPFAELISSRHSTAPATNTAPAPAPRTAQPAAMSNDDFFASLTSSIPSQPQPYRATPTVIPTQPIHYQPPAAQPNRPSFSPASHSTPLAQPAQRPQQPSSFSLLDI